MLRQHQTHHEFATYFSADFALMMCTTPAVNFAPPTHPTSPASPRGKKSSTTAEIANNRQNTLTEKSNSFDVYANANIRGEAARRSPRRELSARPPPQYYERVTREGTSMMHMLAKSFKPQENGSWRQRRFSWGAKGLVII